MRYHGQQHPPSQVPRKLYRHHSLQSRVEPYITDRRWLHHPAEESPQPHPAPPGSLPRYPQSLSYWHSVVSFSQLIYVVYLAIPGCQACSRGNAAMVKLLMKHGACLSDRRGTYSTLQYAAMRIETLLRTINVTCVVSFSLKNLI